MSRTCRHIPESVQPNQSAGRVSQPLLSGFSQFATGAAGQPPPATDRT